MATLVTDENGKNVTANYTASDFWRPSSAGDQLGNETYYTYQPNAQYQSPTMVESTLSFNGGNGNSIVDNRIYMDGLGRPLDYQTLQAPGSSTLDTVSFTYDANGRLYSTSMPCAGSWVAICPSSPATTQTYDALGRPLTVVDGGGGTTTYSYSQNDVLVTVSPAPSGENTKRKQLEYDGLGRLTSVCEITSAAGSGSCGQSNSATGFLTKYTNDALGHLLTVTQNAQPGAIGGTQTRSFVYDGLGRMTSETNPDSGTTICVYDGTSCWSTPTKGVLSYKTDATGTTIMYSYDSLNRMIVKGSYGPNSDGYFSIYVYDAATVGGSPMQNTAGRLAEQVTGYGPSCSTVATCLASMTRVTDEGFSYTARGETSDVYQLKYGTTSYYHTNAVYFANGVPASVGDLTNGISWSYTVDGEGRMFSGTVNGGADGVWNDVTGTTYNATGQPLVLTRGSGDTDTYTYDPNTGRMATYTFSVGATPVVVSGGLNWNANGTLRSLTVTDGFNPAGTQTCNYGTPSIAGYDDLVRLASVVCSNSSGANVWGQSFTYDALGNITKSVPAGDTGISWAPGYSQSTNRLIGYSYDSNGNLKSDGTNTYTWNQDNRPLTVNGGTANVFDARGMLSSIPSTSTQLLLSPIGVVGVMNGSLLYRVPMPGGATFGYIPGSPRLQWHKDWLGSTRITSGDASRIIQSDIAYAPYGEQYLTSGTAGLNLTGDNQDLVAGIFDTPNRELNPTQGRWISPDPAGLAAVEPTNPQTWNRYAYVGNNPLARIDPLGLQPPKEFCPIDWCQAGTGGGGGGGNNEFDAINAVFDPNNPAYAGIYAGINNGYFVWGVSVEGMVAGYEAQAGYGNDPCAYLNNAGTGVESVDHNSSPGECQATQGQWLPPQPADTSYGVDANGNAYPIPNPSLNPNAIAIFSMVANSFPNWLTASYYFSPGTCAVLNHGGIVVLGVGFVIDNPVVMGVGAGGTIASYLGCP